MKQYELIASKKGKALSVLHTLYIQEIKCQIKCCSELNWISLLNLCGHLFSCPFLYGHSPPFLPSLHSFISHLLHPEKLAGGSRRMD